MPSDFTRKQQTTIKQFSCLIAVLFGIFIQSVSAQTCSGSDILVVANGQTCLIREFKTGTSTFTVEKGGAVNQGLGDTVFRGVSSITVLAGGTISSGTGHVLQVGSNNDDSGGGTLNSLNNAGTISGSSTLVINAYQGITITSLTNSGTIQAISGSSTILNSNQSTITTLTNTVTGIIDVGTGGTAVWNNSGSTIGTLNNSGTITGGFTLIYNDATSTIGTINNTSTMTATASGTDTATAIANARTLVSAGTITSINNTSGATLTATQTGTGAAVVINNEGTINSITNDATSTMTATANTQAAVINNTGTIGSIVNLGTMTATAAAGFGIANQGGVITTLINLQGAGNPAGPLIYYGILPTNYNVVINSTNNYGKLVASNVGASTVRFNIYGNTGTSSVPGVAASTLTIGTYSSVLSGLSASNIVSGTLNGNYPGGYAWQLVNASGTDWNLVVNSAGSTSTTTDNTTSASALATSANSTSASTATTTTTTSSASTLATTTTTPNIAIISNGATVSASSLSNAANPVLSGGTIVLNNGASTSAPISIAISGGVIQNPASGTATLAGALTGSGGLTFSGAGTTVLTGTNTYQGGTTIASGTIQGTTTSLQGSITNQGKLVFDQANAGTFSGTIAGSGAVVVQNTGTVVLSGNNSYTGGTTVSGGTLAVAGTAPTGTGDVVISSPATMMGTGSIAGNVVVSGTLKPGNSPGYLAVGSNVTLNTGATYQQDIAGIRQATSASPSGATGYYSFMTVDNQFIINAGTTLAPKLQNLFQTTESGYGSAPYVPNLGDSFRIVTAAGGISGAFSTVTQPAGLAAGTAFITFYNYAGSRSIDLMVIPSSYTSTLASSSSNVQSTATVLDKLSVAQMTGQATTLQSNLMYVAASQTATSLPSFAQALTGETFGAALAVVPQATLRIQNAVLSRINDQQLGISSMSTGAVLSPHGITPQNPLGQPSASVSSNPEVDPVKDIAIAYRPNVWGELAYQYGSRSSDAYASGFNSNLYQTVFGSDFYQDNGLKVGAGFALSSTGVSNTSGNATVGQGSVFVYGKLPLMNEYVLDAMATVGVHSTRVTRTDPTSSNNLNTNNIMGNDLLVSAGISRPITLNDYNVTVTPYARVTWQMVNQSAFDEGSASAAALSVNSYTGNGVRALIGISAGSKSKDPMTEPYTYKVNLAVGTDTNALINPTLNANLASYGTTIQTANVGNTFVQAGLYGSVKLSDNAYAYAGVTGETRSGQTLGAVTLGLKIQF